VGFWDSTETFTFAGFDILYHRLEKQISKKINKFSSFL